MITISLGLATAVLDFLSGKMIEGSAGPAVVNVYQGTRPAYPNVAHSATLLASFTLPSPLFASASGTPGTATTTVDVSTTATPA